MKAITQSLLIGGVAALGGYVAGLEEGVDRKHDFQKQVQDTVSGLLVQVHDTAQGGALEYTPIPGTDVAISPDGKVYLWSDPERRPTGYQGFDALNQLLGKVLEEKPTQQSPSVSPGKPQD